MRVMGRGAAKYPNRCHLPWEQAGILQRGDEDREKVAEKTALLSTQPPRCPSESVARL